MNDNTVLFHLVDNVLAQRVNTTFSCFDCGVPTHPHQTVIGQNAGCALKGYNNIWE